MRIIKPTLNSYCNVVLELTEIPNSVNIANNTSDALWKAWIERNKAWAYDLGNNSRIAVQIEDKIVLDKNVSFDLRNEPWVMLGEGTVTIPHDQDGNKTAVGWLLFESIDSVGNIDWTSGYEKLTSIPRASTVGSVSASELAKAVTVTINRKSEQYMHQIWYRINSSEWHDLGMNIETNKTFTPPLNLAEKITSSDTGTLDICVRTYRDNVQIGNDEYSYNHKIKVPLSVVPTLSSIKTTELNSKVASVVPANNHIQDISKIKLEILGANGVYGSSIVGYKLAIGNQVANGQSGEITPTNAGTVNVIAEITDSRGRKAVTSKRIIIHAYEPPKINVFFPLRAGNRTNRNVKAQTSVSTKPISINGRNINEYRVQVQYSNRGAEQWTTALTSNENTEHFVKELDLGSVYELGKAYDFRLIVTDKFNTVKSNWDIGTSKVLVALGKNCFAIGSLPEESELNMFVSSLPAKFKEGVNFLGEVAVNGKRIDLERLSDSKWTLVPTRNGWKSYTAYGDFQYSKQGGIVYLRGGATDGKLAESVIGVLPVGCRPSQTLYISGINNDYKHCVYMISPNGEIKGLSNITTNWANFDGVSFKI